LALSIGLLRPDSAKTDAMGQPYALTQVELELLFTHPWHSAGGGARVMKGATGARERA